MTEKERAELLERTGSAILAVLRTTETDQRTTVLILASVVGACARVSDDPATFLEQVNAVAQGIVSGELFD